MNEPRNLKYEVTFPDETVIHVIASTFTIRKDGVIVFSVQGQDGKIPIFWLPTTPLFIQLLGVSETEAGEKKE